MFVDQMFAIGQHLYIIGGWACVVTDVRVSLAYTFLYVDFYRF